MRTTSCRRLLTVLLLAFALAVTASCAAPAPNGDVAQGNPGEKAEPVAQTEPAAAATPATPAAPKRPMRTGGPLPPEKVDERKPDPDAAPLALDYSCKADADCAVKNVGNCCGYYPACVNVASPTDPARVQADCARKGIAATCGFPEITACSCNQGRCQAAGGVEER